MGAWSPRELLTRFRRGARVSIARDEFDPRVTADTIVFVAGLFLALVVALLVGVWILDVVLDRPTAARSLLFALPVLVFIATVFLTWEVLRLRFGPADPDRTATDKAAAIPGVRNTLDLLYTLVSIGLGIIALWLTLLAVGRLV